MVYDNDLFVCRNLTLVELAITLVAFTLVAYLQKYLELLSIVKFLISTML